MILMMGLLFGCSGNNTDLFRSGEYWAADRMLNIYVQLGDSPEWLFFPPICNEAGSRRSPELISVVAAMPINPGVGACWGRGQGWVCFGCRWAFESRSEAFAALKWWEFVLCLPGDNLLSNQESFGCTVPLTVDKIYCEGSFSALLPHPLLHLWHHQYF